ncbi:MAG: hypothetical protein ABI949_08190 [Ilumatobacteraceae bacterium]
MGEKGIGGAVAASLPETSSLIEKTTTSVVTSVTGVGQDLVTTIQEKAIGAFADETVRAARERLATPDPLTPPDADPIVEPPNK